MILHVPANEYNKQSPDVLDFINEYKRIKRYTHTTIDFQICIELLRALSLDAKEYDYSAKDHVMELDSVIFAHDGTEPLDALFPELCQAIKKQLFLKRMEIASGTT